MINKIINFLKKKKKNNFLNFVLKKIIKLKKKYLYNKYSKINNIINKKYNFFLKKNYKNKIKIKYKKDINILFLNGFFYKKKIINKNKYIKIKNEIFNNFKKNININNYNIFSYLNIIYSILNKEKSIFIFIKKKKKIKLNLFFIYNNLCSIFTNIKIFIFLEEKCYLEINEKYFIKKKKIYILNNLLINIFLNKKCKVIYFRNSKKNNYFNSINNIYIYQKKKSNFILYDIFLKEKFTLNNVYINFLGNNSLSRIYNIVLANKKQIIENNIIIYNKKNNCNSKQYYIGIFNNRSYGIINGLIKINKETKNNISFQNYKNFILSNKVFFYSKPQLNIFSNNVKCSHGLTIGQIDKNIIFYLQTRSINTKNSKLIFFLSILLKLMYNKYIISMCKIKKIKKLNKKIINKLKKIC
ncbi:MAG: SufD family Fe-S cluster assembly protein [Candidatus Shikimatogenerans bostrichidophilus]|nr:MAG: SufD family Fe-S cluster assembly protein [Candidatus Shikimatogenerans bostrichidophilus]